MNFLGNWIARRRADRIAANRLRSLFSSLNAKSIAIVGNAASLLAHRQGDLIDSHDLVLRMNLGFPVDFAAQGRRLDVWCFSNIRMAHLAPRGIAPPHIVWMSPKFRDEDDGSVPCSFYPVAWWRELRDRLGARPSVGAMSIDLVSRATPAQVTIIGFDFKQSETHYNAAGVTGAHDFAAEARFVKALVERRGWRFVPTFVA